MTNPDNRHVADDNPRNLPDVKLVADRDEHARQVECAASRLLDSLGQLPAGDSEAIHWQGRWWVPVEPDAVVADAGAVRHADGPYYVEEWPCATIQIINGGDHA